MFRVFNWATILANIRAALLGFISNWVWIFINKLSLPNNCPTITSNKKQSTKRSAINLPPIVFPLASKALQPRRSSPLSVDVWQSAHLFLPLAPTSMPLFSAFFLINLFSLLPFCVSGAKSLIKIVVIPAPPSAKAAQLGSFVPARILWESNPDIFSRYTKTANFPEHIQCTVDLNQRQKHVNVSSGGARHARENWMIDIAMGRVRGGKCKYFGFGQLRNFPFDYVTPGRAFSEASIERIDKSPLISFNQSPSQKPAPHATHFAIKCNFIA